MAPFPDIQVGEMAEADARHCAGGTPALPGSHEGNAGGTPDER